MLVLEEVRVTYWATEMGLVIMGQREALRVPRPAQDRILVHFVLNGLADILCLFPSHHGWPCRGQAWDIRPRC